ncbi:hypothetical protein GSI_00443 [Ganoderma sinense ZZ0214-1]|uniref:WIBG Mago-binding domain-containing protein n=1 Tax=Ganoderma sinense ZZ0214-1 TaxID=1077348 RepID=A0A2G8SSM3_9APHY|nr:hypothetical protein GSI_00443 [Ganoderma sinense ZZ0214-1]
MSKPAIVPETTASGIAVDPRTLERIIPESRRPDGSVRKQIKIRPGYTPQEDVRRFRGTRQTQADATALPKGHIIGWTPPPQAAAVAPASKAGMSKAQKKNEKRKEKRKEKRDEGEKVKDNWDDEDEGEAAGGTTTKTEGVHTEEQPNWAAAPDTKKGEAASADGLADKLDKLEVR